MNASVNGTDRRPRKGAKSRREKLACSAVGWLGATAIEDDARHVAGWLGVDAVTNRNSASSF